MGLDTENIYIQQTHKTDRHKEIRDIHANNMADSGIGKRAIASDSIFKSFHLHRRCPITLSTTRIYAEVPILLPECHSYVFHNLYCVKLIQNNIHHHNVSIILMLFYCGDKP